LGKNKFYSLLVVTAVILGFPSSTYADSKNSKESESKSQLPTPTGLSTVPTPGMTSTSVTVNFNAVANASSYTVRLYEKVGERLIGQPRTNFISNGTISSLTPNTSYRVSVQAIASTVNSSSNRDKEKNKSNQYTNSEESKKITVKTSVKAYAVGDVGPAGGIIFYIDSLGFNCGPTFSATGSPTSGKCHYLEAAQNNWFTSIDVTASASDPLIYWGTGDPSDPASHVNVSVPPLNGFDATGSVFGIGYANTMAIINQMGAFDLATNSFAAGAAHAFSGNGFTDWYMPSEAELLELCNLKTVGNFTLGVTYLSSSEQGAGMYQGVTIYNSIQFSFGGTNFFKWWHDYVRPIRAF